MSKILVLGAGRSSSSLIPYLQDTCEQKHWDLTVGDISFNAARERIGKGPGTAIRFALEEEEQSSKIITQADLVVSLLPAHFHPAVARSCLALNKHLLTASYVSDEMRSLHESARSSQLLFLNECGLDPGIDHMSAMQVIDRIKSKGGKMISFESFTGGLIAPETDAGNPWRYKFTWNPRNVVMAGQGTARFLQDGKFKYIPYQQLFQRLTPVTVPLHGEFEGYANRDSLKYLDTYGLSGIKTMLRGTLRHKSFCSAWNILVQLGCCDDTFNLEGLKPMAHADFMNAFTDSDWIGSAEEKICRKFGVQQDGEEMRRLRWSGLFSNELIGLENGTPAQTLEHILNKKWKLQPGDKDFIVMWHRFGFELNGKKREIQAHLTATGHDEINTAMAKTVGLPLGIAAKLLLEGRIKSRGVVIPVMKEIYEPVLSELRSLGIELIETEG